MILLFCSNYSTINLSYGAYAKAPVSPNGPSVKDNNLVVENVTGGFEKPTSIAFLGPNDILVAEKETGKVMRVIDGQIQDEPVLDVAVANSGSVHLNAFSSPL